MIKLIPTPKQNITSLFNRHLIFEDEQEVGTIDIVDDKTQYTIWNFFIHEQFRNKGYGKNAISLLPKDKPVRLNVFHENARAIHIYEMAGFVKKPGFVNSTMWMERPAMEEESPYKNCSNA